MIVNGDDFGMSPDVNLAISECFAGNALSSTTLMVNMPFACEAVRLSKEQGFSDAVGLHLNLTGGEPLTDSIRSCKRFCSGDGKFNAVFAKELSGRFFLSGNEARAVRVEIEAQIKKYLDFGLKSRHLDSHHHIHTDYSIWRILKSLIQKYGIRSVRLSRNLYGKMSPLKAVYKGFYNRALRATGVSVTDFFGSFGDFQENRKGIADGATVEVMVHPKHDGNGQLVDATNGKDTLISSIQEYIAASGEL